MLKYRNSPPIPASRLDESNSACGPVYCGSFELLLNLSDRGRPAFLVQVIPSQQHHANLGYTNEVTPIKSTPISNNPRATFSILEQAPSPDINIFREYLMADQPAPSSLGRQSRANQPNRSVSDLRLTGRQRDVLALMMQGKPNKGICRILGLAEPTVKNHVTGILKVLGVTNRTQAVIAATKLGWNTANAYDPEGSLISDDSGASDRRRHVRVA